MILETIGHALLGLWNFALFVAASVLFLPALLIVTLLEKYWSKKLGELFGI